MISDANPDGASTDAMIAGVDQAAERAAAPELLALAAAGAPWRDRTDQISA
jgi:hypothetical protein